MKIKSFGFAVITLALTMSVGTLPSAFAHGRASPIALERVESGTVQAGKTDFRFFLLDTKNQVQLSDKDLAVMHEKKLHLFVFDGALQEFKHEHPTFDGTQWSVSLDLPLNGNYMVWAQGMIAASGEEFATNESFKVVNGAPANATPPQLVNARSGADGNSKVTLSAQALKAGEMAMLTVSFSRLDGTKPKIQPYLGALAHVVAVLEDGDSLVHVHPMNHGGNLMLHTVFEEAGHYRVWVQFIDDGVKNFSAYGRQLSCFFLFGKS